jgi:hypothetical protein
MGFSGGRSKITGLEVDSDEDIKLDASTGNVIFQDNGTDIVTLDMDTVATQAVFTHNVNNNAALLCFKQYDGVANAVSLDGAGMGGFAHFKYVKMGQDEALDLSDINNALIYSGGVVTLNQGDFAITLPTATDAPTAAQILGWHCRFVLNTAGTGSDNITIIRGDASNDVILGRISSIASGAAAGITLPLSGGGANVITFVDNVAVAGDYVDVTCVFADGSNTKYFVSGMAST